MKPFRTIITPAKPAFQISHVDRLISIGSCFSENIGEKFRKYKFPIQINPFGQQYNPRSIANAINRLVDQVLYTEKDLVFHDELYHSYDHHGDYSGGDKNETLKAINENLQQASEDLKKASILFLTFGTSHVFSLKENGRIVSNCHKLPGTLFDRSVLEPEQIVEAIDNALQQCRKVNTGLKVILTVSPVRYFAFGHYENSVSKAHLFTAINKLQQMHPDFYYFPAYELVMDDLRDYRFFSEDMLHPNYLSTNYVWETLCNTMLEKKTLNLLKEVDEILLAAKHRPRNPNSEAHKKFIHRVLEKIEGLKDKLPVSFSEEEALLKSQL